jgi:hypothetical protein
MLRTENRKRFLIDKAEILDRTGDVVGVFALLDHATHRGAVLAAAATGEVGGAFDLLRYN